jgi:hypothetical protein
MIGGVIILSLLLTALGTMVFVSQLNDQYQQSVNKMAQYDSQRSSEDLVFNYPGLMPVTSGAAVSGWGTCSSTYICYNMTVTNLGGVGVHIVGIYINSTGAGCESLCVLNPTSSITYFAFNQANSFLNAGEVNHALVLALPSGNNLPNTNPPFPYSTILVATTRGNVFSFQWPFQIPIYGSTSAAASFGVIKVAYQKYGTASSGYYDSKNEPGPVAGDPDATPPITGSGGTVTSGYCHHEPEEYDSPEASAYAEKVTVPGVTGNTLYFVNPWITKAVLSSAINILNPGTRTPQTQLYIYAVVTNTLDTNYTVNSGTIDLTWYSTDHIDGVLYGLYTDQFHPIGSLPTIQGHESYYVIYIINQVQFAYPPPQGSGTITSVMFWGGASISTTAKDQNYFAGTLLSSGLWIRASC